jgi:hypothetical protein
MAVVAGTLSVGSAFGLFLLGSNVADPKTTATVPASYRRE